jgi:hypothetical protein
MIAYPQTYPDNYIIESAGIRINKKCLPSAVARRVSSPNSQVYAEQANVFACSIPQQFQELRMRTHDSWQPLSARIQGLTNAGQFAANLFGHSGDSSRVIEAFAEHAKSILSDLLAFAKSLEKGESLKNADGYAREAIDRVSKEVYPLLNDKSNTTDMRRVHVRTSLVILSALEGEITYILRNGQEGIRSLTERAFEHLNRTIVVDIDFRAKWKAAYDHHETKCEALGGVHLLSHGIWAFKASGPSAATDLVYQEPPNDIGRIKRSSDGLVLTEWKRLKKNDDPAKLFESARKQAELYAGGLLGGMELRKYRYAVLVTQNAVTLKLGMLFIAISMLPLNQWLRPSKPNEFSKHLSNLHSIPGSLNGREVAGGGAKSLLFR